MHFEASLVVKAALDRVYSAYTDFEAMPKWSGQAKEVKTLGKHGDTVRLEIVSAGGRKAIRKMRLSPPERVESDGETRFTKTLSAVRFEAVPEGTKVKASLDVALKGRWGWVMKTRGRADAESSALGELTAFGKYVENLP